jgi:hypothetical protein
MERVAILGSYTAFFYVYSGGGHAIFIEKALGYWIPQSCNEAYFEKMFFAF